MVPIKDAISSGAWLHCEYLYSDKLYKFRLKINSFRKISISEIDNPEKIENFDINSILWLMNMEVINLTKVPIEPYWGPRHLILIDQDDFNFHVFEDDYLIRKSNFSDTSGTNRFCYPDLVPKIKAVGSIIFKLPDDDEAEYSISSQYNGSVQEI
ncbi:hypothetical protein Lupro_02030 [Lutibacter profundi]|uniref:Uncharacterized protein n=1 Tax=Lutibacter profundi TaxID=1622118 RepID=A0A0X8G4X1_9FLAO|nr:hypothetical protein [Lutibacter profundi]AMC10100.1 hypothetical protein Lupro_02030 [Lutibacter profundi]